MENEFDLTDLTDKVHRMSLELAAADQFNGKLIRLLENVLEAWKASDSEALAKVMEELEKGIQ